MKNQRSILYLILMMIVVGSLIFYAILQYFWPDWQWINEPLHSTMEALGGFAAIVMAILLFERKHEEYGGKCFLLAMGFLSMGLLDGFHAVTSPGHGFVLLHSMANLIGGFCFALVWLPWFISDRYAARKRYLLWVVIIGSISFGIWTLADREAFPVMVRDNEFTVTAVLINLLAGVFFVAAAGRLLLDFYHSDRLEFYLLTCMALLLGMAELMFYYSSIWGISWWFWHLLRLIAMLLVFKFLFYGHQRLISDLGLTITERRKAEETLRETRNYLENLIDYANAPIIVWDPVFKITRFNHAFERLTGYTADEVMGQELHLLFPEASKDESLSKIKSTLSGERWESAEIPILRKDGEIRLALWNSANIYTEDGATLLATIAQGQDITERKKIEIELRESEEKHRTIFENTGTAITVMEEDATLSMVNAEFEKMTGYSKKEVDGEKKWTEFVVEEDLERLKEYHRLRRIDPHVAPKNYEFSLICKDGEVKNIFATVAMLPGTPKSLGSFIDITNQKQAAEKIIKSEAQHRLLSENIKDIIWTMDLNLQLTYVSPSVQELLGYSVEEAMRLRLMDFLTPASLEIAMKVFTEEMAGERLAEKDLSRSRVLDLESIRKDGTSLPVDIKITFLRDLEGQPVGILGVTRDITERKKAENNIRQQAARAEALARTASRLTAQLDLQTVLDTLCEETSRALNASAVSVRLYNEETQLFYCAAVSGLPPDYITRSTPVPRTLHDEYVCKMGPIIIIPDVQTVPDLPGAELYREMDVRTVVVTNLLHKDQLVGTLNILAIGKVCQFTEDEIELLKGLADQGALAISNAHLFNKTKRHLNQVEALRNIDMAITASLDLRVTFNVFLDQFTSHLGVDAADILLMDPYTHRLENVVRRGFRTSALEYTRLPLGDGLAGRAAMERNMIRISNLKEAEEFLNQSPLLDKEGFVAYFGVPLMAKGQVKGVLECFHRSPLDPDLEWLDFLEALAGQAAVAIDNATLFTDLQKSNLELMQAYDTTLEGWSKALDLRDKETEGHSQRVTEMTTRIARAMGISNSELVHVRRGALLHDIGKLGVPDHILLKPGPLTEEEWEIMRKHPRYTYELLYPIAFLRPATDIPYGHHEKWDGSGYPRGLKGEQISLAARIFAVVDVWDALRSARPYRLAWPEEKAREYIREQSGKQFDPNVVEAFFELING